MFIAFLLQRVYYQGGGIGPTKSASPLITQKDATNMYTSSRMRTMPIQLEDGAAQNMAFFSSKNLKAVFRTSFRIKKRLYTSLLCDARFFCKWQCPQKAIFRRYFKKYYFFRKNCPMKIIRNFVSHTKKILLIFVVRHSFPLRRVIIPKSDSSQFSLKILLLWRKQYYDKIVST